jgi:hypothetical protein
MPDVLATIGGVLSVASAVNGFSRSVADVVSKEDLRMATKLAGLMSDLRIHVSDIRSFLKKASKAKTRQTKGFLCGMALEKAEVVLLTIRDIIRVLTRIWFKPGTIQRMLDWVKRRRVKSRRGK